MASNRRYNFRLAGACAPAWAGRSEGTTSQFSAIGSRMPSLVLPRDGVGEPLRLTWLKRHVALDILDSYPQGFSENSALFPVGSTQSASPRVTRLMLHVLAMRVYACYV
jgi:hypothetical protein